MGNQTGHLMIFTGEWCRCFRRFARPIRNRRKSILPLAAVLERLEGRQLLAATVFDPAIGALTVTATNPAGETLRITRASRGETLLNGVAVRHNGVSVAASTVSRLIVEGVAGPDTIDLTGVTVEGFPRLNAITPDRIQAFGRGGDDTLIGSPMADQLHGDDGLDFVRAAAGNDAIDGGNDQDVLFGEVGHDTLSGGDGRDILVGATGSDNLSGGNDDDILIAGTSTIASTDPTWATIRNLWKSNAHYHTRVTQLITPNAGARLRVEGPVPLTTAAQGSVRDDETPDSLTGGDGRDWFFRVEDFLFGGYDTATDRNRTEAENNALPIVAGTSPTFHGTLDLVPMDAVTHTVATSGSWSDAATWVNGQVPTAGANLFIPADMILTVDGDIAARVKTIRAEGTVRFDTTRNTTLRVDTLVVDHDGCLEMGTPDQPMPANVTARILITDTGLIDRVKDPFALGRGIIALGCVELNGAETTHAVTIVGPLAAKAREIALSQVPINWKVGDRLVIAGTTSAGNQDEVRAIQAINGNRVTVASLSFAHTAPKAGLAVHVVNLTRNVRIESEATAVDRRGHFMIHHSHDSNISFAEFNRLGRTDKRIRLNDTILDDNGNILPGTGTNQRGRYSVHFHRNGVGPDSEPVVVRGSVVTDDPGWGYTNHSSNVDFINNVAFNVAGTAFMTEAGDEIGSFDGNVAIRGSGSGDDLNSRFDLQDFGHEGNGFWFQGAGVSVTNNITIGQLGHGFIWYTRGLFEPDLQKNDSPADVSTKFLGTNVSDPRIAAGAEKVEVYDVPITDFRNNIAYACQWGVSMTYVLFRFRLDLARPRHDVGNTIDGLTLWNNVRGLNAYYVANATFRNITVVGTSGVREFGIKAHLNSRDLVFENINVEGYSVGISMPRAGSNVLRNATLKNTTNILVQSHLARPPVGDETAAAPPPHVVLIEGDIRFTGKRNIVLESSYFQREATFAGVFAPDIVTLNFGPYQNRRVYFAGQSATAIPFRAQEKALPPEYVRLTNQQLLTRFGISIGGSIRPANAIAKPGIIGGFVAP